MNKKNKSLLVMVSMLFFSGCGPAKYADTPNSIQRAEVLSKNKYGITVEHSKWGKKIAFRFADEHCATIDKVAVFQSTGKQYGPDNISSWKCKK